MDWLFEADRDAERRFPWISIPGVTSNIDTQPLVLNRILSKVPVLTNSTDIPWKLAVSPGSMSADFWPFPTRARAPLATLSGSMNRDPIRLVFCRSE